MQTSVEAHTRPLPEVPLSFSRLSEPMLGNPPGVPVTFARKVPALYPPGGMVGFPKNSLYATAHDRLTVEETMNISGKAVFGLPDAFAPMSPAPLYVCTMNPIVKWSFGVPPVLVTVILVVAPAFDADHTHI